MNPQEVIRDRLTYARQRLVDANHAETTDLSLGALIHTVELLLAAVEALSQQQASAANDP
jgi:hypothetical protein